MSKLTLPIFFSMLVIWLIGATWWFNKKYDGIDTYDNITCNIPLIIEDGNFQTKAKNNIIFEFSDWEPVIPMQALASLKSVALYLANSPKKSLVLTGKFGLDEMNNSDFPNNGFARAEAIKSELVTYGAPDFKIKTEADSSELIPLTCNKILEGIEFEFVSNLPAGQAGNVLATLEEMPAVTVSEKGTPEENVTEQAEQDSKQETTVPLTKDFNAKEKFIVFYEENSFKPDVSEEMDNYFKKLTQYLKEHPKDRLLLMGHTDNVGDAKKHFNYGKYRARKLRDVLLEYGIEKRRLKTDSKGSAKPISSNRTSEGRYQNRRVEISIIQR